MSQGREFFEDMACSFAIIGNPRWASFGTQRMDYGMLGRGGHPIAISDKDSGFAADILTQTDMPYRSLMQIVSVSPGWGEET
jgi:hypothetical protein